MQAEGATGGGVSRRSLVRRAAVLGLAGLVGAAGRAGADTYEGHEEARILGALAAPAEGPRPHTLRVLWQPNTTERVMALTFDDGPMERFTRPLLEVLENKGVPATFCVVGLRAEAQQDLVRRELSGRHELVNHTWSHPDLSQLDEAAVEREIARTDDVLTRLTGHRPALFRPPYGRLSGRALRQSAQAGHDVLVWNVLVRDRSETSEANARRVLTGLSPGTVVLGHDQGPSYRHVGMQAVPAIIDGARARGYRFVTASEMFAGQSS